VVAVAYKTIIFLVSTSYSRAQTADESLRGVALTGKVVWAGSSLARNADVQPPIVAALVEAAGAKVTCMH
jgi:hypothetical protein